MERYVIRLPEDRSNTYNRVTFFILLINLVLLVFIYTHEMAAGIRTYCLVAAVINLVSLLFFLIRSATKMVTWFRVEIAFIVLGILWLFIEKYLLGLGILSIAVIGMYARRRLEIIFLKDGIIYPSFPRKFFLWKHISNVILKDKYAYH